MPDWKDRFEKAKEAIYNIRLTCDCFNSKKLFVRPKQRTCQSYNSFKNQKSKISVSKLKVSMLSRLPVATAATAAAAAAAAAAEHHLSLSHWCVFYAATATATKSPTSHATCTQVSNHTASQPDFNCKVCVYRSFSVTVCVSLLTLRYIYVSNGYSLVVYTKHTQQTAWQPFDVQALIIRLHGELASLPPSCIIASPDSMRLLHEVFWTSQKRWPAVALALHQCD